MNQSKSFLKNPPRAITVLLCMFPLALLLFLLHSYAVNIPYFDEWNIIYLFERIHYDDLKFDDLWRQHNEHRIFFPKLFIIGLGLLTDYNVKYLMVANVCIAGLIWLLIFRHICKNKTALNLQHKERWLGIIFAFCIFSISQYENWFWGFQVQWFLNLAAVAAGAYVLANFTLNITTVMLLFSYGAIATFSLSSGVLYWPIVLGAIIVHHIKAKPKHGYFFIGIWIILSGSVLTLYLADYYKPPSHPRLLYFLDDPLAVASYILIYIGNPFSLQSKFVVMAETFPIAKFFGGMGILLFIAFMVQTLKKRTWRELQPISFFLIIGLYGLLCAVLTALGRAEMGHEQARSSRYITMALLLWLAVIYMLCSHRFDNPLHKSATAKIITVFRFKVLVLIFAFRKRTIKAAKVLALVAIIVCFNWTAFSCIKAVKRDHLLRSYAQQAVLDNRNDYNFLKYITGNPEKQMLKKDIPRLSKLRLSVFGDNVFAKNRRVKINPQVLVRQGLKAKTWDNTDGLTASVNAKTGVVSIKGDRQSHEAWGTADTINDQAGAVMTGRLAGSGQLEVDVVAIGENDTFGRGSGYKVFLKFWNDTNNHISIGFVNDADAGLKQINVMAEGRAYRQPIIGYWDSSQPALKGAVHHLSVRWSPSSFSWTIDNNEQYRMTYIMKMDRPRLSLLGAARLCCDSVTAEFHHLFIWPVETKFRWLAQLFPIKNIDFQPLITDTSPWYEENTFVSQNAGDYRANETAYIMNQQGLPFLSSYDGTDTNKGRLKTVPFDAPARIGLYVAGYPTKQDNDLYLEHLESDEKLYFINSDPGESWREIIVAPPPQWQNTPVRIAAIDNSDAFKGWFGVTAPYSISFWHPFHRYFYDVYREVNEVRFSNDVF
ncbi:hypothetical protein QUF75_00310 [Desulfococcaceae bacterium HSG7]|nr:hypothetical protein [Desulfococcaceae bacterium HSG7]